MAPSHATRDVWKNALVHPKHRNFFFFFFLSFSLRGVVPSSHHEIEIKFAFEVLFFKVVTFSAILSSVVSHLINHPCSVVQHLINSIREGPGNKFC